MNRFLASFAALIFTLLAPNLARACGEGSFNAGKGLSYQGYLAPRPTTILVFGNPDPAPGSDREALIAGLRKAGHTVSVIGDRESLLATLGGQRDAVVIAALDAIDDSPGEAVHWLPVVERSARNSARVRGRFPVVVLGGSSLGQYLRAIDKAVGERTS